MAKKNWLTKTKTDEEVEKELREQENTNYLRKAPKPLQRTMKLSLTAGIVLLIISVILMFTKLSIGMIVPPIVMGVVAFLLSISIRNEIVNGTYKTFKGTVVNCEYPYLSAYKFKTFPKAKTKAVIFASDDKRYRITYSTQKLKIGDIVTVYASSSVLIYERNGCYNLNSYYAVEIEQV